MYPVSEAIRSLAALRATERRARYAKRFLTSHATLQQYVRKAPLVGKIGALSKFARPVLVKRRVVAIATIRECEPMPPQAQ